MCTRRKYEMVDGYMYKEVVRDGGIGVYVKCVAIADRKSSIAAEKPKR